jgi:hypothetical protein
MRSGDGEAGLDVCRWPAGNQPQAAEKAAITAACERLIAEVLRPRFLPEVRRSATFNYPVGIEGKWLGNKYLFFTRYRSDDPASLKAEFGTPFARLDYVGRARLDLMWHRHTGEWHCVSDRLSLTEALHWIESEPYFQPC